MYLDEAKYDDKPTTEQVLNKIMIDQEFPRSENCDFKQKHLYPLAHWLGLYAVKQLVLKTMRSAAVSHPQQVWDYITGTIAAAYEYENEFIERFHSQLVLPGVTRLVKSIPKIKNTATTTEEKLELIKHIDNLLVRFQSYQHDYFNKRFAGVALCNSPSAKKLDLLLHAAHF